MASSHISVTVKLWQRASVNPSPEDGHLSCAASHSGTGEVAIAEFIRPVVQFVQTMLVHTFALRSPLLKEAATGAGRQDMGGGLLRNALHSVADSACPCKWVNVCAQDSWHNHGKVPDCALV